MYSKPLFDPDCKVCKRLHQYLAEVKLKYPDYYARPVPSFGDRNARLLIVGLAPGMHGANATGRPFSGDSSGLLLYETLFRYGFSNQKESMSMDDGLQLNDCRISNAVKCVPPQNKPLAEEINQCNRFLIEEIKIMPQQAVILVLGTVAHQAVLKAYGLKRRVTSFGHNQLFQLPDGKYLLSSYHCSRYNLQTKRLTAEMFDQVFDQAQKLLN